MLLTPAPGTLGRSTLDQTCLLNLHQDPSANKNNEFISPLLSLRIDARSMTILFIPPTHHSLLGLGTLWAGASEHVKVYVRLRPPNEREQQAFETATNGSQQSSQGSQQQSPSTTTILAQPPNHIVVGSGYKNDTFTYDCVGDEDTTQEQVFNDVGKSIVEQCVKGYNGTIFAYGQTGSGKTYTMQGPSNVASVANHKERGIIPRCLEYLFELIAKEEQMVSSVKYLCKASYIEIYNESIYDLLDNSTTARATREDIKRGVYVDGVTEESIHNPKDAYKMFEQGAANRHTSATAMNRESSRSHTVLTLTIQSMILSDGINHIRESRFNLVDLAGSERQKLANTEGLRLKEAGSINRSLLCLGSVINALGEIAGGHSRHVHYRDSRLTFLLKDSLGGNSNTFIVANISPSALCYQETLSTLRFAQRAKMIKNKAVVNEDIQGNVNELQAEIQRLKAELEVERTSGGGHVSTITTRTYLETLGRLRQEQADHAAEIARSSLLEEACKAREKQFQSAQLVVKFKESALASHRKGDTNAGLQAEKAALLEEIAGLKKQLDFHPEVFKVSAELAKHVELLKAYERFQSERENYEERQKQAKMYFEDLAAKIVELGEENEVLRSRLGSATPKNAEMEDVDFPRADGIDDLMTESPPKIRDEDRRFSSDMKSLLQRVAQTRQAEYRRLSGSLRTPDGSSARDARSPSAPFSTPTKPRMSLLSENGGGADDTMMGINLSDSLSATSNLDINDSPSEVLLKRDIERMTDQYAVLERRFDEAQLELLGMEQTITLANEESEAKQKVWNAEREESVKVLKIMEQASIDMEQELTKIRSSYTEVEQLLRTTTTDLKETRQRLVDTQKEYDAQVQYNASRNKEFQEKEIRWDETKAELVKAKEETEILLAQEKSRTMATQSELDKELFTLSQECDALMTEKARLEKLESTLKSELEKLAQAGSQALEEHNTQLRVKEEQHAAEVEAEKAAKTELQEKLRVAQERVEALSVDCESVKQTLKAKTLQANKTLLERETELDGKLKSLESRLALELKECESRLETEAEVAKIALQKTLVEKHEQDIQVFKVEAEEQGRALADMKLSLTESLLKAEQVLDSKRLLEEELTAIKNQYQTLGLESEALKQDKIRLEGQVESLQSKCAQLEKDVDGQRQELSSLKLQLQHDQWEKTQLETAKSELRTKVSDMARKIGETEQKLEQARDGHRMLEMEYRTVQDELEHQLGQTRNELAVKTNENQLNEEYKRKFRELRAQFADLGPTITERQQQGFHERELKRVMELEKMKEEINHSTTHSAQLEASLVLAQEMNEQLLEDSKANTMKIADQMEKRLQEVEVQLRSAEQELQQALDSVQQKSKELQQLSEEAMVRKESIQTLEEELSDERKKVERLEQSLTQHQEKLKAEEQEALALIERQQEQLAAEAKQKQKVEQMLAHQKVLLKMKEEQQMATLQEVERREKAQVIFEGLTTENGKLREQVRDLGNVNESIMKHQNQKQKLQYHVKIKQQNNELRIENQRLMFRAIELEEKLGNKDNVASLRKQVREMHGASPYQSPLELGHTGLEDEANEMELIQGLDFGHLRRASSSSPPLSSEASSSPTPVAIDPSELTSAVGAGLKRKANTSDVQLASRNSAPVPSAANRAAALVSSRKRPAPGPPAKAAPPTTATRQRALSSSSGSTLSSVRSTAGATPDNANVPLGPRARAKAAADAALAAAKGGRRQGTPVPMTRTPQSASVSTTKAPFQRVSSTSSVRSAHKEDPLRGSRAGGAITKPKLPLTTSTSRPVTTTGNKSTGDPASASAQRAREREARIAAATAALQQAGNRPGNKPPGGVTRNPASQSKSPEAPPQHSSSPSPARSTSGRNVSSSPQKQNPMTNDSALPDVTNNVASPLATVEQLDLSSEPPLKNEDMTPS